MVISSRFWSDFVAKIRHPKSSVGNDCAARRFTVFIFVPLFLKSNQNQTKINPFICNYIILSLTVYEKRVKIKIKNLCKSRWEAAFAYLKIRPWFWGCEIRTKIIEFKINLLKSSGVAIKIRPKAAWNPHRETPYIYISKTIIRTRSPGVGDWE